MINKGNFKMNWYKLAKKDVGWSCVKLNKTLSNKIIKWGKNNIEDDILFDSDNYGRELDSHITVMYGIIADRVDIFKKLLEKEKPIKAILGKIGYFEAEDNDCVIIKVDSSDLERINGLVGENLNTWENHKYKPHCTIAYVKKGEAHKYAGDTYFKGEKIVFDEIFFENSNGEEVSVRLKG